MKGLVSAYTCNQNAMNKVHQHLFITYSGRVALLDHALDFIRQSNTVNCCVAYPLNWMASLTNIILIHAYSTIKCTATKNGVQRQ